VFLLQLNPKTPITTMSANVGEEEELVDYEEDEGHEEEVATGTGAGGAVSVTSGAANGKVAGTDADGTKKGSYVGIHSTGFRWVWNQCRE
jgi:ATP-dependent RNA helicase UAP56/SUB2